MHEYCIHAMYETHEYCIHAMYETHEYCIHAMYETHEYCIHAMYETRFIWHSESCANNAFFAYLRTLSEIIIMIYF